MNVAAQNQTVSHQEDQVMALESSVHLLPQKDQDFAKSLLNWAATKPLSTKQMEWVEKLNRQALSRVAEGDRKADNGVTVGQMSGLLDLFKKAKENLKFPKITLNVGGTPIILSVAGPNSKAPGHINVMGKGSYPYAAWYGRVSPAGVWAQGHKQDSWEASGERVEKLLKDLSEDPAKTAMEYGKLSGNCCFCGAGLTDEHSTAVGYGRTCAKNWGLLDQWKKAVSVLDKEVQPSLLED